MFSFEELIVACAVQVIKHMILFVVEEVRMAPPLDVKKDLNRLQHIFLQIQHVLEDAKKQQMGEGLFKIWLKELRDVAYEADDILDEYSYQLMHSHEMSFRKRDWLRQQCSSSNPLYFRQHMARAIKKVNDEMDRIAKEKARLDLLNGNSSHSGSLNRDSQETTSFIEEKQVIGRKQDKANMIDSLLRRDSSSSSSSSTVSVIPIVGMGGLGKTTLAKLIFNAEVVSYIFELRIWVHVSTDFNMKKILRDIVIRITKTPYDRDTNMDVLESIIKENLSGKRYLLVLDDLWNVEVEQWNRLKNQLDVGEGGSKIIVTTRSDEVADVIVQGRANSTYTLQELSESECCSIIMQSAFAPGGPEETQNLVSVCKDMATECRGVPLAAKNFGDLLHSMKNEAGCSYLRDANTGLLDKDEMLRALRFSYIQLPSPLRQCFAYCSLFRKDSILERQTLIQLWIAEGFVHPSDRNRGKELEDIGNDYFRCLLKNSLLKGQGRTDHNGDAQSCKLHHHVHDLAQDIVGSNECSILKVSQIAAQDTSELRRLSLILEKGSLAHAEIQLKNASKLRTLFIHNNKGDTNINYQKLLKNKRFRVLDMQGTSIKGVPSSIGNMQHLRYLNLSRTEIKELPEFITGLYNLQTLLLRYCVKLRKFPETMGTLKRMRYLDISGSQFEELPDCITHLSNLQTLKLEDCRNIQKLPGNIKNMINLRHLFLSKTENWSSKPNEIGSLTRLQTLTQFKVGKCNTSGFSTIRELECLNLLEGELWISNLEEVTTSDDAEKANLKGKQNIQSLIMEWRFRTHDASDGTVMKQLQPNRSLKKLKIVNYQDPKFPTWMMGSSISSALPNLVEIELRDCYLCQQLPGLGQLPSLKVLTIATMDVVTCLGNDFYGDVCQPFPELVKFTLTDLPSLEKWYTSQPPFPFYPRLEKLFVERCPMLERRQDLNFFFPAIKEYKLDGATLISRPTLKMVSLMPSRQS